MELNGTPKSSSRREASGAIVDRNEAVVLFALTARERRLFFPGENPSLPVRMVWAEQEELSLKHWSETIERVRPTVLVSCWKTPPLSAEWLDNPDFPLRYVCHLSGSVRKLVPRIYLERGIAVTNWGEIPRTQVAEHALLLALAALRNQGRWREFIAREPAQRAISELGTRTLHGRRIGIHGFGMIARSLIQLLRPFGVSISVFAQGVPRDLMAGAGVGVSPSLATLFSQSEVLFECEALTPATAGTIDADVLGRLPDGAVFVNVARGGLVDEAALWREAKDERIRLALDVVRDEPVSMDCPAMHLPGAVVSPHIGGPTSDRYAACGEHALRNIGRFLDNIELESRLTPEVFDRST